MIFFCHFLVFLGHRLSHCHVLSTVWSRGLCLVSVSSILPPHTLYSTHLQPIRTRSSSWLFLIPILYACVQFPCLSVSKHNCGWPRLFLPVTFALRGPSL